MIKLQVIGNLGKDCIVKEVNGKNVINFSVAHSERFKDAQGNQKERTTWVECAYWTDKTAVAQYLVKGKTVYAEGTPEAEGYTNKDGNVAGTLRMRVQTVQLLGGNPVGDNQGASGSNYSSANTNTVTAPRPANPAPSPVAMNDAADDLPF